MALSIQSPGVVFREVDNTFFPENIDSSIVGVVGLATKGPTNKPTLITNQRQLIDTFGLPAETIPGQGLEGALEILETTNELFYVRASNGSGTEASAVLAFGSCPAVQIAATSGFGITTDLYLKIKVYNSASAVERDTSAAILKSELSGLGKTELALQKILGDGTANDDDYGVAYYVDNDVTSIFLYGTHVGGKLEVSAFSAPTLTGAVSCLGEVSANGTLVAPSSATASAAGSIIKSETTGSDSFYYLVNALYEGTGYNQSVNLLTGETTGVGVEVDAFAGAQAELTVNENGIQSENYYVSLLNDDSFIEEVIIPTSNGTKSQLIKAALKRGANDLSAISALDSFARPLSSLDAALTGLSGVSYTKVGVTGASPRFVKLVAGASKGLTGGLNYFDESNYTNIILGNQALKTGIYALDDDTLNISIGIVPGVNNQTVQNALITLAETSQNFIAVISPPYGFTTAQQAVDWMNGKSTTRTASINSSWAAVIWPWVQTFNTFDGKDIWYDPAIYLVRQMTFTDAVAEPWFAPAGFRRGRLTKPTNVELGLSQGDRDFLYKNNINPINNFIPEGITIFGQKTAQRIPSSLDRINVRRLMIYLRKLLLATGRPYIFEPNDAFTWEQVKNTVESVLSDIQGRRGIIEFRVVCDETVNTPVRVARKEMWCKIILQPTEAAEYIVFEVNLTNQATSLGE